MPSVTSLEKQQYYGHPRNVFWRIMAALFNEDKPLNYQQGQQLLQLEGIAIWDVLKSCERQGSLDADINKNSIKINNFIAFFETFTQLRFVFFNGGTAELLYKRNVYPLLPVKYRTLKYAKLPSTSPAYASMCYKDKLAAWAALKNCKVGSAFLSTRLYDNKLSI